jgi:hypothetical protein
VKNEKVFNIVKEEKNMYQKRRKVNRTGYILRENCRLKHISDGKIEGTGRREERRKQLLDYLREREDTGSRKREH